MSFSFLHEQQDGFTLVELAIVMIIIGLLIGGVLKGEELIENARMTAVVQKIHPWEVAMMSFRTSYGTIPGDLRNASNLLPDCSGDCALNVGNGNRHLDGGSSDWWGYPYRYLPANENQQFWWQLAGAGLLDEISAVGTDGGTITPAWGVTSPVSPHDAATGFAVFEANLASPGAGAAALRGIQVILRRTLPSSDWNYWWPGTAPEGAMTARQTHTVDTKLDDGIPGTGRVRGIVVVGQTTGCAVGAPYDDNYNPAYTSCNVLFKIAN